MFILWVRGGAYFLHFAAGTDLSFCKLEEKREKAARWVTHRGSHSKPHIQVDSSVCFFYEGFKGGNPASSVRSILPGSLWPLSLCTCCVLCLQHQASLPLGLACKSLQPSACRDVPFGLAPVPQHLVPLQMSFFIPLSGFFFCLPSQNIHSGKTEKVS